MADITTVRYVTPDPIQNIKLQVTIKGLSRGYRAKSKAPVQVASDTTPLLQDGKENDAMHTVPGGNFMEAAVPAGATEGGAVNTSRVFSWQEKVHSRAEVEAFRAQMGTGTGDQSPTRRQMSVGPNSILGWDKLLAVSGNKDVFYTYVNNDKKADELMVSRTVTTSATEGQNFLVQRLLHHPRNQASRQQVLNYKSMYIMVDVGLAQGSDVMVEKELVHIKAYPDGSFDMRPGFSRLGGPGYRFEDGSGRLYEYRIENASQSEAPGLEARIAKLSRVAAQRAEELRHGNVGLGFEPPPGSGSAMRLLVLAEIMAVTGFKRNNLFVEFAVHYNPKAWTLQSSEGCVHEFQKDDDTDEPIVGIVRGSSQVAKLRKYPEDVEYGRQRKWVAHLSLPVELEWTAETPPSASQWPIMYFQVSSYDSWNRYTTEGYGWLPLRSVCQGCVTHYVETWKPEGTRRDQAEEYYIGGTPELGDLSYLAYPTNWTAKPLNKYGFKTATSGTLKVRINSLVQQCQAQQPQQKAALQPTSSGLQGRDVTLAVVVERARSRLIDACGGDVFVRPGAASQAPSIRRDPVDVTVAEGGAAEMKVDAGGLPPLRYQWYKDNKRMAIATSDTPNLVIAETTSADNGSYFCRVSNADGSEDTARAQLTVRRIPRMRQAGIPSSSDEQSPSTPTVRRTSSALATSLAGNTSPTQLKRASSRLQQASSPSHDQPITMQEAYDAVQSRPGPSASGIGSPSCAQSSSGTPLSRQNRSDTDQADLSDPARRQLPQSPKQQRQHPPLGTRTDDSSMQPPLLPRQASKGGPGYDPYRAAPPSPSATPRIVAGAASPPRRPAPVGSHGPAIQQEDAEGPIASFSVAMATTLARGGPGGFAVHDTPAPAGRFALVGGDAQGVQQEWGLAREIEEEKTTYGR